MAAATQSAPTSAAGSSTATEDQSSTNPVQGWFSDTWQKMPWNGDAQKSADGSNGEGNGSSDQQPTTDGSKSVLPDQITNLWQKMPWNGTANGTGEKTSGDSDATVNSKTGNDGDSSSEGGSNKSVQDQFTDFWHKMPWNSTANDSTQPAAANGTANTNGDANADGQQPASATAGLTDLWSKTTGFFEKIGPSTTASTTTNADASADTAPKTASSSEA